MRARIGQTLDCTEGLAEQLSGGEGKAPAAVQASASGNLHLGMPLKTVTNPLEVIMSFGKGALLWLIGIPLPIILLIALFWR